jgi:hypothetical protein
MFKKKLKKEDMDLGEMIDEFILHTESKEAVASDDFYRQVYKSNKLIGKEGFEEPLPKKRDMNFPLMANDYREFLMVISDYMKQDQYDSFKGFLKNTDKIELANIKNQHYATLPIQYFK